MANPTDNSSTPTGTSPIVGEVVELGTGYSPEVNPAVVDEHTEVMSPKLQPGNSWAEAMKSIPPQNIA